MKSYPIQLCGDYFINHEIGMPIKQPGFYGKYPVGLFSWLDLDQKNRRGRFVRTKKNTFLGWERFSLGICVGLTVKKCVIHNKIQNPTYDRIWV